jgi:Tfp pilus assembly protein PilO
VSEPTPINNRRLACEFLVAAALCASAYYLLAQSAGERLAKVRAEIAEAQAKDSARAGVGNLSEAQVRELQQTTADRIAAIRERSEPAIDEAVMFARVSELAVTHGLRVDQLSPSRVTASGGPAPNLPPGVHAGTPAAQPGGPVDPAAPPVAAPKDSSVIYTMTLIGSYTDISAFLDGLTQRAGYSTVRSIRLSQPDLSRPDQLRAAVETEHFAFDVSAIKVPPSATTPTLATPASTQASD